MKLSDIKGESALDIMADAMELAEIASRDGRVRALAEEVQGLGDGDRDGTVRALCRHLPALLRDPEYKGRVVSIFAAASGVTAEEYAAEGPMLQDMLELLTSDAESLGFLLGRAARGELAG